MLHLTWEFFFTLGYLVVTFGGGRMTLMTMLEGLRLYSVFECPE